MQTLHPGSSSSSFPFCPISKTTMVALHGTMHYFTSSNADVHNILPYPQDNSLSNAMFIYAGGQKPHFHSKGLQYVAGCEKNHRYTSYPDLCHPCMVLTCSKLCHHVFYHLLLTTCLVIWPLYLEYITWKLSCVMHMHSTSVIFATGWF